MNDTKITLKNYWSILKEELSKSKNKRATSLIFIFFVLATSVLQWIAPASSSVMERLIIMAPLVVGLLLLILAIPLGIISRRKYENSIMGKNHWEIAGIKFRQNAISILVMFIFIVLLDAWSFPLSDFGTKFFALMFVCVVVFILFLVATSLFKRKSPKAIVAGYICLISFLILAVYLCFNSLFENKHGALWIFSLLFPIQGLVDIYKASKYTADVKRDSELQK